MVTTAVLLGTVVLGAAVAGRCWGRGLGGNGRVKVGFRKPGLVPWLLPETGGGADRKAGFAWLMGRFRDSMKEKKQEMEPMKGGVDARDSAAAARSGGCAEHLVVMVNGIFGSADNWKYAAEQFFKKLPDEVIVHRSQCNYSTLTFDGVDLMGERLSEELPFLCGLPFLEQRALQTAHLIVGRTGKHLFLTDNDDGKPPLLLRMVDDCGDLKFRSALRSFRRRVAYANSNFDLMVGWRTSSIRRQHELPNSHLLVSDEKYPHVIYVDRGDIVTKNEEVSSCVEVQTADLEEEMIRGLTQVAWERVDVSFRESAQRYIAHSTIQVETYWMNSDGADVISHMIDNFII